MLTRSTLTPQRFYNFLAPAVLATTAVLGMRHPAAAATNEQASNTSATFASTADTSATNASTATARTADPRAVALIDTAIARMGGESALKNIQRVRFDQVVQWLGVRFDGEPHADVPSYNWNSELRDYTLNSSRKTRRQSTGFPSGGTWPEFIDVVQDTVGMRQSRTGQWGVLHLAYVDEQRESFGTAPERLLLAAHAATDAHLGADSVINKRAYARVLLTLPTLSKEPATIFFRRDDGLPLMVRFRAAQPLDGGLAPWGVMEVETWWSRWQAAPLNGTKGVVYPMQWDVNRSGQPYQRFTTMAANFNVAATPDSFVVSDSIRRAVFAGPASRPMWQNTPVDSAAIIEGHFAAGTRMGQPPIAVLVGNRWVLLEGNSPLDARKLNSEWLVQHAPGTQVGAMLVTSPTGPGVGAGWLIDQGAAVYVAPSAEKTVATIGKNWGDVKHGTVVTTGRWIRFGTDSMFIAPFDAPTGQALLVYVPSLRWLYSSVASTPASLDRLLEYGRKRNWTVDFVGSGRNIRSVVAPVADASRSP